jgi:hypothetical protein
MAVGPQPKHSQPYPIEANRRQLEANDFRGKSTLGMALLYQHIAPRLQRIGPARSLIGILEVSASAIPGFLGVWRAHRIE